MAILDTETQGLDPAKDRCIEVAVCLYDLVTACPVRSYASLIRAEDNAAESINRIPAEALKTAPEAEKVWRGVEAIVTPAEAFVAHRADFDRAFVPASLRDGKPWVCSKTEIDWPRGTPGESLVTLALAHDLGVSYAHRASADVDLLARLFSRCRQAGVDLVDMMAKAMRPRGTFQALVSIDDRQLAKDAGFLYDPVKKWTKRLVLDDMPTLPFKVKRLDAGPA